jgi:hypothetical protein
MCRAAVVSQGAGANGRDQTRKDWEIEVGKMKHRQISERVVGGQ